MEMRVQEESSLSGSAHEAFRVSSAAISSWGRSDATGAMAETARKSRRRRKDAAMAAFSPELPCTDLIMGSSDAGAAAIAIAAAAPLLLLLLPSPSSSSSSSESFFFFLLPSSFFLLLLLLRRRRLLLRA
jgi:hypothetical protein